MSYRGKHTRTYGARLKRWEADGGLVLYSAVAATLANMAIAAPLVTGLQRTLGQHMMQTIRRRLLDHHQSFKEYYQGKGAGAGASAGSMPPCLTMWWLVAGGGGGWWWRHWWCCC